MTTYCTICPATLPDTSDAYACTACAYRIRSRLRELPQQLPLLQAALVPGGRSAQGRVGGRAHSPAPLRLDVLDILGPGSPVALDDPHGDQTGGLPITPMLYGWALAIAREYPSVTVDEHGTQRIAPCQGAVSRHGATAAHWCAWLLRYLPYAVTRPWIAALDDELGGLIARVRAITQTTVRTRPLAAPCPACEACALAETDGEWMVTCQACGRHLTRDEYTAYSRALLAALEAEQSAAA